MTDSTKPCKHGHTEGRYKNGACRVCQRLSSIRWGKANPEAKAAAGRRWRVANPQKNSENKRKWREANHEKHLAYNCEWRKANPGKIKANTVAYSAANSEKIKAKNKRWREANPEKVSGYWRDRMDLYSANPISKQALTSIRDACEGLCVYCGENTHTRCHPRYLSGFDHIWPLFLGGKHEPQNLVVCCWPCNTAKSTYQHFAFFQE